MNIRCIIALLITFLSAFSFQACSSDDDNPWMGFEKYEGKWSPTAYKQNGEWISCNPSMPEKNNVERFSFIKWEDNKVIVRIEYYYGGVWKHRADTSLYWIDGAFYEDKLDHVGNKCEDIYITSDGLLNLSFDGVDYSGAYKLKKQ